jgi:hypothetical protein
MDLGTPPEPGGEIFGLLMKKSFKREIWINYHPLLGLELWLRLLWPDSASKKKT